MKLDTRSVDKFTRDKEQATKELLSDKDPENPQKSAELINFFGLPWWDCPATGKRCVKDCFCLSEAWSTEDSVLGFKCTRKF